MRTALIVLALSGCARVAPGGDLVIHAAVLIDGDGGVRRDCSIVIRDGRIAEITPGRRGGARVIEAGTAMPGLIDCHAHFCLTGGGWRTAGEAVSPAAKRHAALRCGITWMRSLGDDPDAIRGLERVRSCGRILTGPGGHPTECIGFERAAREVAGDVPLEEGDTVKLVHDGAMAREDVKRLIAKAKGAGRRCVVHVETKEQALDALGFGADGIEHVPRGMDEEVIAKLKETGATWVPTLAAEWARTAPREAYRAYLERPEVRRDVPPSTWRSAWLEPRNEGMDGRDWVLKAHRAGAKIAAGSDAGAIGVFFGPGLLRELELLVEAGMTPAEAIHCATGRAGEHIGVKGSLSVGGAADLLLVRGDATKEIRALYDRVAVLVEGVVVPERAPAAAPGRVLIGDPLEERGGRITGRLKGWAQLVIDAPGAKVVTFRVRGIAPSLRVEVGTENGPALGGYGKDVTVTSEWTRVEIPFESLQSTCEVPFDGSRVLTVRFALNGSGRVDVEIDSVHMQ
jgi:enamidase